MIATIKAYWKYIELVALIVLIVAAYTFGHHTASVDAIASQAKAVKAQSDADNAELKRQLQVSAGNAASAQSLAVSAAEARQKTQIVYQTITQQVTHYVETHPDSESCRVDDDGLRIWREANSGNLSQ